MKTTNVKTNKKAVSVGLVCDVSKIRTTNRKIQKMLSQAEDSVELYNGITAIKFSENIVPEEIVYLDKEGEVFVPDADTRKEAKELLDVDPEQRKQDLSEWLDLFS